MQELAPANVVYDSGKDIMIGRKRAGINTITIKFDDCISFLILYISTKQGSKCS